MIAKKVINQRSPMWQGIWIAWCKVQMGDNGVFLFQLKLFYLWSFFNNKFLKQ
jgi:hypothetical protein